MNKDNLKQYFNSLGKEFAKTLHRLERGERRYGTNQRDLKSKIELIRKIKNELHLW